jgi:hypothetical protein
VSAATAAGELWSGLFRPESVSSWARALALWAQPVHASSAVHGIVATTLGLPTLPATVDLPPSPRPFAPAPRPVFR